MRKIQLNGKFLSAAPTGVHRVAAELGDAIAALIAEGHPAVAGLELEIVAPKNGMAQAEKMLAPVLCISPFNGILWEQIALPLRRGKGLLLSLCNIAPILSRNAVTMIHDVQVLLSPQSYRPAFRLWYRLVQPLIVRRQRHILTVSEFSRSEIVRAGLCQKEKITVIHNGVDHILRIESDDAAIDRLEIERGSYVVALANTQLHKNIAVLMQAFADPALPGLRLVLFGGATAADFLAAGTAVPQSAIFAGRISDAELRGLLENALCLAFPSTTEGFGLPPLEAMLLGCPVIAAPCGALPEVCGDAALYARPDDAGAWTQAIAQLAGDAGLRARMKLSGREWAGRFTWRASAIKLAQVLSQI